MAEKTKKTLALVPADDVAPEVGLLLSALEEARVRTREVIAELPDDIIDKQPKSGLNTIGTLLYHIAIVEADWLFDEILGTIGTDWPADLFPMEMREDGKTLSRLVGETLAQHVARLDATRALLVEHVRGMSTEDLHSPRDRTYYDVSPAFVLHHLMQEEAEHRAQIRQAREELGSPQPGW